MDDVCIDSFAPGINEQLRKAADLIFEDLRRTYPERLVHERADRTGFEARLFARWARALDLFEVARIVATEAGDTFNKKNRPLAVESNDFLFDALVRIHARACSIATEVQALLLSGHSTAAMARWRSLHELSVVAFFLSNQGGDVAERYMLHSVVESCKAATDYEQCREALGYTSLDANVVARLRARRDELCQRYGPEFSEQYGWAAAALQKKSPTFRDIEKAVGLDHMRAHYRLSSHGVHANPKGVLYNIGLIGPHHGPDTVMVAGPTNAGLADPGHLTLLSLYQCTVALLCYRPDKTSLTSLHVLHRFVDVATAAFLDIHNAQVAEQEQRTD